MCPHCGLVYKRVRTGFSYQDVYKMLWVGNPDSSTWRYKRRNTILGVWHAIKQSIWKEQLLQCEHYAMQQEATGLLEEELVELVGVVLDSESLSDIPF